MPTKKQKIHFTIVASVFTFCNLLLATPFISSAQSDQPLYLTIAPDYKWTNPSTLNLPTTFVSKSEDSWVYQAYDPANNSENIKVSDLRSNGGFSVTLAISDFIDSSHAIDCTV